MAANNKNQKAVDRILHPIEGEDVSVRDLLYLEGGRTYIDFGLDNLITKRALQGLGQINTYEVPVTASGLVIDWQNDLIDGLQTYAQALGDNLPRPVHYFKDGDNYTDGNVKPAIVKTAGEIITVTFDWGYSTDCVIVF